ncbi:MAG: hypothetical protein JOZ51_17660, partial [Chloroflexi bacterium]|nr:hypothetical protein [Chloroflexota bacterium]
PTTAPTDAPAPSDGPTPQPSEPTPQPPATTPEATTGTSFALPPTIELPTEFVPTLPAESPPPEPSSTVGP